MAKYPFINMNNDTFSIEPEEWRYIDDYDGLYEVSSLGRVRRAATDTIEVTCSGAIVSERHREPYYLTPTLNCHGYYQLGLTIHNKTTIVAVHLLVARAFFPQSIEKVEIHHIDGISTNNRVDNLVCLSPELHRNCHTTKNKRTYLRCDT